MKKYNLRVGIPFSMMISVVAALFRLIRFETADLQHYFTLFIYFFCFSLLCWIANHLLLGFDLIKRPVHHRLRFSIVTLLWGCLFTWAFDFIIFRVYGQVLLLGDITGGKRLELVLLRGTLINWFIGFVVYQMHQMKENEQDKLELEHLKQANLQANLSSLKEQLSPHFLFNTLNTLTTLTHEQPVKDYVEELANVYRYLLSHRQKDWVTIKEELDFIASYLYIIKTRLEKAIEISIRIDPEFLGYKIPPVTIQLLVENAIKHNVAAEYKPLKIDLVTEAGYLVIVNNYQPKKALEPSSGIGLNNIIQRYQLLFEQQILIDQNENIFKVQLPLIP